MKNTTPNGTGQFCNQEDASTLIESEMLVPRNRAKRKIYPNIPAVFKSRNGGASESGSQLPTYPEGYRPFVDSWSVPAADLMERLPDGVDGARGTFTLTQLDISINSDDYVAKVNEGFTPGQELTEADQDLISERAKSFYDMTCGLLCLHCFEKNCRSRNLLMGTDEVFKMLLEAKELGLKHVKFLGPGELVQNPRLFEILDFLEKHNIKIGIFTKGVVLGDDDRAQELFGMTAKEMCRKIASYKNVTVLLGLTSADRNTENRRLKTKNPHYFEIRNRAFENMAEAGLNKDPMQQRMAIICAPVLRDNVDEVVEIYKYGMERNIPVIVAPTMLSGGGCDMKEITDCEFKSVDLVKVYIDIYSMLIKEQILTLEQVEDEGISPYAGYACNQFISGMLVRKDGQVMACPGNDKGEYVYERDVRKKSLKEIFKNSMGYKLRERLAQEAGGGIPLTQPCYAKTEGIALPCADGNEKICVEKGCGSIPDGFYEKVMAGVKERIAALGIISRRGRG